MEKNKKKMMKIIGFIFVVLITISGLFLSYSLILFNNLERFYIIIGIILIIYLLVCLVYGILKNIRLERFKRYLISIIISVIFTTCFSVGGYYIYNVYGKINKFNKDSITYTTSLITFNDKYSSISSLKKVKIGIVKDEDNIELYTIPNEIIQKNKLKSNNEIIEYPSVVDLINALNNETVDVIFINGNYQDIFYSLEEFSNIKDAKLIETFSKTVEKEVTEKEITTNTSTLTEPFTILLLGIDSETDGLDKNAAFNGDTIMLLTFNPETLNATMFSVPRDTYVKIACGNRQMQKINTSAYGGASCVIKTLKNMTGIDVDYYAKINFRGVVDLVDALGGINVEVPYKFCEQNSNREFGEHTIYLEKGFQTINGEQALALARNRKGHSEYCSSEWNTDGVRNDFVRGQNQQLVVESMLNQVKNIKSANKMLEILDIVSRNIDTNLSTEQMLSFYDVVKTIILAGNANIVNIDKTLLTGYDMYVYEPSADGTRYAFFNWKGSLDDIVDLMETNLGKKESKIIKEFSYSINSPYEKKIVGVGSYKETKLSIVPDFSSYSIDSIKSWGSSNNISVSILDSTTKKEINSLSNYTFSSQSIHAKTLVVKSGNTLEVYYKEKDSTIKKPIETETGSTNETDNNKPEEVSTTE